MTTVVQPVRVLDLRDTHEIGGPGKTILETFKAVDPSQFELHVGIFATRNESADTPFTQAARACGLPVHVIRGFNQYDPRLVSRTAALIRELRIDIVHAHEVKSDVIAWLSARLADVRTVTTLHGWIGNSARQRLLIALDQWVAARLDCVIVVSEAMRGQLADRIPPDRLQLVHNGIVVDRYSRTGRRGRLQALIRHDAERPVLVSIGRLSAEKGHADLIDAVAALAARGRHVSLVLVGDGPERASLRNRADSHRLQDRVFMTGYLDEPQQVLEEADLAVLPSHTEGLPNVALEALAMEVPVLATRVGGTPEVITDGRTGRLVPARSPQALAAAIEEFIDRPAEWAEMASSGRAMVEQRFDFGARTRRVESLYRQLVMREAVS